MKKSRYFWPGCKLRQISSVNFSIKTESEQFSPSLLGNLEKFMDLSLKNKLIDSQGSPLSSQNRLIPRQIQPRVRRLIEPFQNDGLLQHARGNDQALSSLYFPGAGQPALSERVGGDPGPLELAKSGRVPPHLQLADSSEPVQVAAGLQVAQIAHPRFGFFGRFVRNLNSRKRDDRHVLRPVLFLLQKCVRLQLGPILQNPNGPLQPEESLRFGL